MFAVAGMLGLDGFTKVAVIEPLNNGDPDKTGEVESELSVVINVPLPLPEKTTPSDEYCVVIYVPTGNSLKVMVLPSPKFGTALVAALEDCFAKWSGDVDCVCCATAAAFETVQASVIINTRMEILLFM